MSTLYILLYFMFENIIIININYRDRQHILGCLRRSNGMTEG